MPVEKPKPQRGLPAIAQTRELRASRPLPAASGKFWLWALIAIIALTIFYWKKTQSECEAYRTRILTKQRSILQEAGPLYVSLRDKVERWTISNAQQIIQPDFVDPEFAKSLDAEMSAPLLKQPGIYLRLAQPNALSVEAIRKTSQRSLRDAFTACFLHTPHLPATDGATCKKSKDCARGEVCNELERCITPTQPYNLRVAYKGLRVLSDDWVHLVETTDEPLKLRLYETDIDESMANDVPTAIDLLTRAKYFLVVIDEIPQGLKVDDEELLEQTVQSEVHPTRVALYDLTSDKLLMRVTKTADVTIPAIPGDASNIEAVRRQVLNCALADEVRAALKTAK